MSRILKPGDAFQPRPLEELNGCPVVARVTKNRRDYTARELRDMANRALEGNAPAGSVADVVIRRLELEGEYLKALELRAEVKAKAPTLDRLARAAERAERRAAKRAKGTQ